VGAVCLVFPDRNSEVWKNLIKAVDIESDTDTFIDSLKNDFEFISQDVSGVLLYGSLLMQMGLLTGAQI